MHFDQGKSQQELIQDSMQKLECDAMQFKDQLSRAEYELRHLLLISEQQSRLQFCKCDEEKTLQVKDLVESLRKELSQLNTKYDKLSDDHTELKKEYTKYREEHFSVSKLYIDSNLASPTCATKALI